MRSALWQLGLHDCYHMHDVQQNPEIEAPQWVRAMEAKYAGKGTVGREDWDKLLGHCQAVCDIPAALFGVELAKLYPDAKVIILHRDPEAWYESVLKSIYTFTKPTSRWALAKMIYCVLLDAGTAGMKNFGQTMVKYALPYDHGLEKDKAIACYNAQYQEWRDNIPADRCIEMNIKDGWKPLCDHLGLPVPTIKDEVTGKMVEAPFPRMNDREDFQQTARKIRSNAMARANNNLFRKIGKLAVTGAAGYAVYLTWKTRLGGRI